MKTTFSKISLMLFAFVACISTAFAQLSVSLSTSTYGAFNVSCFGGTNGWVQANPSGGTSPYTYQWSNSATTQTINNVAASFYVVTVTDAASNTATAGVTLKQPTQLNIAATRSTYPNSFNISCFQCYNGSITLNPSGGVGSYTFLWNDAVTTQNRSSIGGGDYTVTMTDGNGCTTVAGPLGMAEPPKDAWNMTGNTNSNPTSQYIGTADNKDLVFKTNATERMRVLASGSLSLPYYSNPNDQSGRKYPVRMDAAGNITVTPAPSTLPAPFTNCPDYPYIDWFYNACNIVTNAYVGIGTLGNTSLLDARLVVKGAGTSSAYSFKVINANDELAFVVRDDKKVGIGTDEVPSAYMLAVKGKIISEEVKVKLYSAGWPDYVFEKGYEPMPLKELENFIKTNKHLPEIPSAKDVAANEGVEIGDMLAKLLKKNEEQTLYIIELSKKIEAMESQIKALSSK